MRLGTNAGGTTHLPPKRAKQAHDSLDNHAKPARRPSRTPIGPYAPGPIPPGIYASLRFFNEAYRRIVADLPLAGEIGATLQPKAQPMTDTGRTKSPTNRHPHFRGQPSTALRAPKQRLTPSPRRPCFASELSWT